ncbi:uncharacterized protein LY79DRAFT_577894 [Colletotrichum navitas]|uniref:Uncharacterized protein n=1 Tax=Colletotrichum navitas TaxID=681940 RepID=A0AAD8Q5J4_9PEZI|nr:uncharacterized protein LY79DRAFT_577894 [Colletotrichum navitas]KAK1595512.1 hypothetical protein LY79DRAFT_577894 [Colletotrichum navitas]
MLGAAHLQLRPFSNIHPSFFARTRPAQTSSKTRPKSSSSEGTDQPSTTGGTVATTQADRNGRDNIILLHTASSSLSCQQPVASLSLSPVSLLCTASSLDFCSAPQTPGRWPFTTDERRRRRRRRRRDRESDRHQRANSEQFLRSRERNPPIEGYSTTDTYQLFPSTADRSRVGRLETST